MEKSIVKFRTNPKQKWIKVENSEMGSIKIKDRVEFISMIFICTDIQEIEIKIEKRKHIT